MVVNPRQVLETITQDESTVMIRLEKKIDSYLVNTFNGGEAWFDMNGDFSSLRQVAQEKLLNKYRTQGWNVRLNYDQRDGNAIVFSYGADRYSSQRE